MDPARTPEYTRELVEFLHGLRAEDLPAEVLDRSREPYSRPAGATKSSTTCEPEIPRPFRLFAHLNVRAV